MKVQVLTSFLQMRLFILLYFFLFLVDDVQNTTPDRIVPEARGLYTLLVDQEEEFERVFHSLF